MFEAASVFWCFRSDFLDLDRLVVSKKKLTEATQHDQSQNTRHVSQQKQAQHTKC